MARLTALFLLAVLAVVACAPDMGSDNTGNKAYRWWFFHDDQHHVTAYGGEARGQRQLVAVVAGEPDRDDIAVFRREFVDQLPGAVGRSIVDHDQFVALSAQHARGVGHLAVEFAQAVFLVVAGYNDGQKHLAGARHPVLQFHGFGSLSSNELVRLAACNNR